MKKVYYLSTCSTCKRIMSELNLVGFEKQDIKTERITETQLEEMKKLSGSFEALFSKKSLQYRAMGLHNRTLSEADFKDFILKEYTFLKRPVFIINDKIFVGNNKNTIEELKSLVNC